ncbi:MAG: helix-turn-helix domain-containing protein [Clostridiales bacterium]|nr:helix-turn-helix domain-containing protein [Clostridiales bacterium]
MPHPERFKLARTKYNTHGPQSSRDVAKETGLSVSVISNLENGHNRSVGYEKILCLANHYDVSLDWLLGQSSEPRIQKTSVDELQLSPYSIDILRKMDESAKQGLEFLLESDLFQNICARIYEIQQSIERFEARIEQSMTEDDDETDSALTRNLYNHDSDLADRLLDDIISAHPELTDRISVSIGFDEIALGVRNTVELFEELIKQKTGFDFYESQLIEKMI